MLSHAQGPPSALLETTIGEELARTARRFPDREALVSRHQSKRFTWRELDEAAGQWAAGLAGMGIAPGERVGIWAANCWEWVVLQVGAARAGVVLVNVNPAYRSHELGYVMRKSRMKALFLWERDARTNYREIFETASREGGAPEAVYLDGFRWPKLDPRQAAPAPDDVVNIQYTSGTTGSPKGVLLTHRNILNNGMLVARQMKLTEQDRICLPVPLYHCFGCVMGILASVVSGCAVILPAPVFTPQAVLEAVNEERATALYGVPTMFIAALDHPDFARFDPGSLRTGIMAGAPCPVEVMRRVVDVMHCREITIAYGQTESSPVITMSQAGDPLEIRVATVGAVLAETEVKIIDPETGGTVERGTQGELCARGYLVMKGYDGEEEATRKAIDAEGWLHTGDLAVMREDGYCKITGRAKDMIIRGGENIYPREVEEFFYTHPKIADVQVVGLPDARYGEIVAAWVQLKPGEKATGEELREWCRGKIAHYKVPKHIRIVESFPMTVTGKIQKFRIREIEIDRLGLEAAARIETA